MQRRALAGAAGEDVAPLRAWRAGRVCSTKGQLMAGRDDPSLSSSPHQDDHDVMNCISWVRKQIQVVVYLVCPGVRGEKTIRKKNIRTGRRQETEGVSQTICFM